jgi:Ca-activated chloride channel family protein
MMNLAHPGWLWLLPVLMIPLIAWYIYSQDKNEPEMNVSSTRAFDGMGTSWKVWLKHFSFALKLAALACLIIILCRPQTKDSWSTSDVEGTDIVIALDVSTSMLARDFNPNRFESAKKVATRFVSGRDHDNIGLVLFAGESFTQVPMTMDNATLVNAIGMTEIGTLEDGTAIGDGIATAINRIRDGKAKSKSIILLTDGSNNTGVVAPNTAADIARKYGIKIYTIGVGSNGTADYPVAIDYAGNIQYQRMPVVIDETTLKNIAATTGGKYFRATDNTKLSEIYAEINKMEKVRTTVDSFPVYKELFGRFALVALICLLLELALRLLIRRLP